MAAVDYVPAAKVAFQGSRRFWELDEQIYGGISWTEHPITQIWYPSEAYHDRQGVLTGAYNFSENAAAAGRLPVDKRLDEARAGAAPSQGTPPIASSTVSTVNAPSAGAAWAGAPEEAIASKG